MLDQSSAVVLDIRSKEPRMLCSSLEITLTRVCGARASAWSISTARRSRKELLAACSRSSDGLGALHGGEGPAGQLVALLVAVRPRGR